MKNKCYPLHDRLFKNRPPSQRAVTVAFYELRTYVYTRRKRRGAGDGKGQESAMGKVCLLCMGCLVAGFVGQSIVALLTLNLGD